MTDGIRKAVKEWTGDAVTSCPWRSFFDPFVRRVMHAMTMAEHGNLAFAVPHPSARLTQGIAHYTTVDRRVRGAMMDMEAAEARKKGARRGS